MKRKLEEACVIADERDSSTMRRLIGNFLLILENLFAGDIIKIASEMYCGQIV
jgi:hypothetical protein